MRARTGYKIPLRAQQTPCPSSENQLCKSSDLSKLGEARHLGHQPKHEYACGGGRMSSAGKRPGGGPGGASYDVVMAVTTTMMGRSVGPRHLGQRQALKERNQAGARERLVLEAPPADARNTDYSDSWAGWLDDCSWIW